MSSTVLDPTIPGDQCIQQSISDIESGKYRLGHPATLKALADALTAETGNPVTVADLTSDSEEVA